MIESFRFLLTVATLGGEPRLPSLLGLVGLCWKLGIDQFHQVDICAGIVIRGKSEPFPLDILDCLFRPFVFLT